MASLPSKARLDYLISPRFATGDQASTTRPDIRGFLKSSTGDFVRVSGQNENT